MDFATIRRVTKRSRKQTGTRIETPTAFFLRFYHTAADGTRRKKCVKLADKGPLYQTWQDVEPLIERELAVVNGEQAPVRVWTIQEFVEGEYLPWVEKNRAAVTLNSYTRIWELRWKERIGRLHLTALTTAQVTEVLTHFAKAGLGSRSLSHIKWFLSGVYQFAVKQGVVKENPVSAAGWLCKVRRDAKPAVYTLPQVLDMLRVLEPVDIRAALAVALCYFAALRPSEARGLKWEDYDGEELTVRRGVWRGHVGETKTEDSAASVPVIEPLRGLLERLGALTGKRGFILQNANHKPISLDSLNYRLIAPTLKKAGIEWHGYYAGRRGISSLVTDTSKNALNSTGLLRHSTPITALKHYTRAQKESIKAALEQVEKMATKADETVQ